MGISTFLFRLFNSRRTLQRSIERLIFPRAKCENDFLKIAVVQMEYTRLNSVKSFTAFLNRFLSRMQDFCPDIIVFPGFIDTTLFGLFPLFISRRSFARKLRQYSTLTSKICESVMAEISRKWSCSVVFGTSKGLLLYHEGQPTNGTVKTQKYSLAVVPKHAFFNSKRLAKLVDQGVRVIASAGVGTFNYNEQTEKKYCWVHSQMVGFYGLWSVMTGKINGGTLMGKSYVTAPIPVTNSLDGYIVKSDSNIGDVVLLAELDLQRLEEFLSTYRGSRNHKVV